MTRLNVAAVLLLALVGCEKKAPPAAAGEKATIKLGQTMPYTGPASAYSVIGKANVAYFKMVNERGGIHGHNVELITYDDAYNPSKTVEQARKLVENDGVLATFGSVGTAPNAAIYDYMNQKKVPQLFIGSGGGRWGSD